MDHKQTISFTMAQKSAISIAAKRAGLSFAAYVRSASISRAADAGVATATGTGHAVRVDLISREDKKDILKKF